MVRSNTEVKGSISMIWRLSICSDGK